MTSKTISVGGEVGTPAGSRGDGLRVSVSVSAPKKPYTPGYRTLTVKVGALPIVEAAWDTTSRDVAIGKLGLMLATAEPDLCKYLTRALMEVEL